MDPGPPHFLEKRSFQNVADSWQHSCWEVPGGTQKWALFTGQCSPQPVTSLGPGSSGCRKAQEGAQQVSGEQGCVCPCGHREWGEATGMTPTLPGATLGPGTAAPSLLQDHSTAASAELGAVGLCLPESPPPS